MEESARVLEKIRSQFPGDIQAGVSAQVQLIGKLEFVATAAADRLISKDLEIEALKTQATAAVAEIESLQFDTRIQAVKNEREKLKWRVFDVNQLLKQEQQSHKKLIEKLAKNASDAQELVDKVEDLRQAILEDCRKESGDSVANGGFRNVKDERGHYLAENVEAVAALVSDFGIRNGKLGEMVKSFLKVFTTLDVSKLTVISKSQQSRNEEIIAEGRRDELANLVSL